MAKRLTKRVSSYKGKGIYITKCTYDEEIQALARYEDLEEQGRLIVIPETGIGDLSDGYHTFNELYHHRAVLFSVICNSFKSLAWKSKKHDDGTMYNGMFIVGITTPEGDATYHYDIEPYWNLFDVKELDKAPEWDGHTPSEAIERILKLAGSDEGGVALTFDLEITCRPSEAQKILKLAEKLKYYEDLEEQGRLIELPCAVGDTVWTIDPDITFIDDFKVTDIDITKERIAFCNHYLGYFCYANDFGKIVFLTKEEAEEKLKELRGERE